MSIQNGTMMIVKDEVWKLWCFQHLKEYCKFEAQPIINLYPMRIVQTLEDSTFVMLAFPFYWWRIEDLEEQ
jgi:hypothetical protein